MIRRIAAAALVCGAAAGVAAQTAKPAATKGVTYDVTIKAEDTTYTGTVDMIVDRGKVTGSMRLVAPSEITAKVAGTAKAGVLDLDFPYHMVQEQCDGNVKMKIKLPPKPGPAAGTMSAVGCGREPERPLDGTVQLVPADPKKK